MNSKFLIFANMYPISQNIDKIKDVCVAHDVEQLFAFGSVTTAAFGDQSDIDLLVQFNAGIDLSRYFDNYMAFKEELEAILLRQVDITENQAVRNPVFRMILERDKRLIYERKNT